MEQPHLVNAFGINTSAHMQQRLASLLSLLKTAQKKSTIGKFDNWIRRGLVRAATKLFEISTSSMKAPSPRGLQINAFQSALFCNNQRTMSKLCLACSSGGRWGEFFHLQTTGTAKKDRVTALFVEAEMEGTHHAISSLPGSTVI